MPVSPTPPARPSRVTTIVQAEELPRAITGALPVRPPPGTRFRVTIEPVEESEDERRQSLQADIAAGLEDADAGRITDSEKLFERLIAKYAETGEPRQG
ncbi:hypothetical protein [Azospirillum endophyticum]